jgi:hypothetical protein
VTFRSLSSARRFVKQAGLSEKDSTVQGHAPCRRSLRSPLHGPSDRSASGGRTPPHVQGRRLVSRARRRGWLQAAELDQVGFPTTADSRPRPRRELIADRGRGSRPQL